MSEQGVFANLGVVPLVLTASPDTVDVQGSNFMGTNYQRWIYQFDWTRYQGTLQNKETGNYLSWDSNNTVIMTETERFWQLIRVDQNVFTLQVPQPISPGLFFTLTLSEDGEHKVVLKPQQGNPVDTQKWRVDPR